MPGHRKFSTLRAKMTPDQQTRSRVRATELRTEMLLGELRKHAGKTQQEVALDLGVSQPALSQMESQEDIQVGTLTRLVASYGGELELIAHMPQGDVSITQFVRPKKRA